MTRWFLVGLVTPSDLNDDLTGVLEGPVDVGVEEEWGEWRKDVGGWKEEEEADDETRRSPTEKERHISQIK